MNKDRQEATPRASIAMDGYGEVARAYIRTRTAANSAAFLLGYLQPGMALLDCGCGEGTITVGLAEKVAPGNVVGLDIASRTLESARLLAVEKGLDNLRFEVGSVYELPFADASFDVVFAHTLFEHLANKSLALAEIKRVLRTGGLVALRSPDDGAILFEPRDPLIDTFWELFGRIRDALGGDTRVGQQLCRLLYEAGFSRVTGSASFETYGTPEATEWFGIFLSRLTLEGPYSAEWLARGWAEPALLEEISAMWRVWGKQTGAFAAWSRCEAVGWKE